MVAVTGVAVTWWTGTGEAEEENSLIEVWGLFLPA